MTTRAGAARRLPPIAPPSPRFTVADARQLEATYRDADTRALLTAVLRDGVAGRAAVVSSFGAESAVLLHLVASLAPATPVLFLDTGKHFAETLTYRDALVARLGLTRLITLTPDSRDLAARDATGLRWSYDPDGCCALRKVAPLARALDGLAGAGFDAVITGRKGFQSAARAGLARFELEGGETPRLRINPLADWSREAIIAYVREAQLPTHPLLAQGFLSIGCSPCTSRVTPGEDPRAGRWRGWDKIECGIHAPGHEAGAGTDTPAAGTTPHPHVSDNTSELPPDYQAAF